MCEICVGKVVKLGDRQGTNLIFSHVQKSKLKGACSEPQPDRKCVSVFFVPPACALPCVVLTFFVQHDLDSCVFPFAPSDTRLLINCTGKAIARNQGYLWQFGPDQVWALGTSCVFKSRIEVRNAEDKLVLRVILNDERQNYPWQRVRCDVSVTRYSDVVDRQNVYTNQKEVSL